MFSRLCLPFSIAAASGRRIAADFAGRFPCPILQTGKATAGALDAAVAQNDADGHAAQGNGKHDG